MIAHAQWKPAEFTKIVIDSLKKLT
jgi:hypothetical protein